MAQLKDTVVTGNLNVTNEVLTNSLQTTTIKIPIASGSTTLGPGTAGQIIKTDGSVAYWSTLPSASFVNNITFTQGTLPTISTTKIAADDITSWSAGTLPSLSTKDTSFYVVTSTTTTATKVVTKDWTVPNVTSVGTAPTLVSSSYTIPNITSVGTLPAATYSAGVLTFTAGSLPTLGDSFSVAGISTWSAGTTPTLGTAITVTGVSSNSSVTVPILSSTTATTITGVNTWSAGSLPSLSYTAREIPNVTAAGTLPTLTSTTASAVTP